MNDAVVLLPKARLRSIIYGDSWRKWFRRKVPGNPLNLDQAAEGLLQRTPAQAGAVPDAIDFATLPAAERKLVLRLIERGEVAAISKRTGHLIPGITIIHTGSMPAPMMGLGFVIYRFEDGPVRGSLHSEQWFRA